LEAGPDGPARRAPRLLVGARARDVALSLRAPDRPLPVVFAARRAEGCRDERRRPDRRARRLAARALAARSLPPPRARPHRSDARAPPLAWRRNGPRAPPYDPRPLAAAGLRHRPG